MKFLMIGQQMQQYCRVYQLKHTNFEDKQWVCQGVKRRFRSAMHTNSNVNAVLKFAPHAQSFAQFLRIERKKLSKDKKNNSDFKQNDWNRTVTHAKIRK
ncbi:hypothetical protein T02_11717, partial [Trichinella nativa]